ncbi:UTP--glucose-1-phosphate uridylyltransferase 3, chloroplastic [Olea europaea subsp. europaea]|uniref:UTP--glucose-1-phosphate uridylyltransferase 3, chloroplastic n=2 Tax=Olea europaea subsp. europaea TaxID=158383 RepID=A0A8S0TH20_OLEEU|nr:UTP--glucose-1-phosphate uridylyltransferase 3, chloroplastic [Olea europaea subsp. europaea]
MLQHLVLSPSFVQRFTTKTHTSHTKVQLCASMARANTTPVLKNNLFTLNSKPSNSLFFSHNKSLSAFSSSIFSSATQLHLHSKPSYSCIRITRVSTAPVEYAPPAPEFNFQNEIARLKSLKSKLDDCKTLKEKMNVMESDSRVKSFFDSRRNHFARVVEGENLNENEFYLLNCVVAAGQGHVLGEFGRKLEGAEFDSARNSVKGALYALAEMIETWDVSDGGKRVELKGEEKRALRSLLKTLGEVEQFYDCLGGIIGYQITVLELLAQSTSEGQTINWFEQKSSKYQIIDIHPPNVLDLSEDVEYASQAAIWGIEGLPDLGEICPLGGSADRLGLVDPETGECLPAAMLPYCGRTLLEGLIRDLQAREFLYFKLYGKQCITPVAIMTSSAKNNHWHITSLCERLEWFGRGRSRFLLFEQPLVPAVSAEDGEWVVTRPYVPLCKPGGHGVIWKLAYDKGVFKWFHDHGRKGATVRQVSNVVAATDMTLLALAGIGLRHRKKLGFASCQRNPGATEGINVLLEKKNLDGKWAYGLSCIEYTEFDKFGITVGPPSPNSLQAEFPANTNILYVDLPSAELIASSKDARSLPGMVLNVKKPITFVDEFGMKQSISGGRLECTMQNIADNFTNMYPSRLYKDVKDELDTFIVYNERRKVTSSAKKKRKHADKSFHQTPDGSLLDIMRNAYDLLSHCGIKMPKVEGNEKYVNSGPPYLILLHPALGPLWEVTRQKFHGGSISTGSELQIEISEFLWRDVQLDGSLIILAENVIGSTINDERGEPILQYGRRCARCKLQNVRVLNDGINWNSRDNLYWKHDVQRFEALKVILHGNAEFEATNVVIQGNHVFEVPDGYTLKITAGNSGLDVQMKPIGKELMDSGTWFWNYKIRGQRIQLSLNELLEN